MHDFKKLNVWQLAVELVTDVYKATESFPRSEQFGITSQIRRSAVSVPSNIAEGAGRKTDGEFRQFLGFSYASSCELETQLIISNRLGFLAQGVLADLSAKLDIIQKKSFKLDQSLKK